MGQSCLQWLLRLPFRLMALVMKLVGRAVLLVVGIIMIVVGAIISLTVIGACLGLPLILLGFLLVIRGLF